MVIKRKIKFFVVNLFNTNVVNYVFFLFSSLYSALLVILANYVLFNALITKNKNVHFVILF